MEFRILGPVEVEGGREGVEAGPAKQRIVLVSLLLTPGQLVPVEVLVDRLWGEEPPSAARDSLYAYVARLRRVLKEAEDGDRESVQLLRNPGGYLIDVDADRVDLHRFRRLVDTARTAQSAGDADRAVRLLRAGLALWRGTPVAGLPGDWADRLRARLSQQRIAAMVDLGAVELDVGRHAEVVDDLAGWFADHPLAEPLAAHLMVALYRCGRGTEALTVYERTRQHLAGALGSDPGPRLQQLHQQILRQDPALAPPVAVPPVAAQAATPRTAREPASPSPHRPSASTVPAQLPADVAAFTGRVGQLDWLDALLPGEEAGAASAVAISAIGGAAGVGKTALAVHWAHRVAGRFPDGQLYVNLRGFDPGGSAMAPGEALRGFLDAFEVPPQRIPAELPVQAALFRSLLAGRRVLILLDNARDADQVRPLLPGSPGCLAVVTSRNQLSGLVAAEGARPLALDLLTTVEARELLAGRIGADRVEAEPDAVGEIVNRCTRLPLALAIAAARAATNPEFPLATLAEELRDSRGRLDALAGDDTSTDLRAVLSWSYRTLSPPAARLFRLLGLHPGPDVTVAAAVSLAGVPPPQMRPLLAELTRAQLVREHNPGRYAFHDLLRAYATELVHEQDPDDDRRNALGRVLDYYLHTANAASLILDPHRHPITLTPPGCGVTPKNFRDGAQAMAWFRAERPVLLAAVESAANHQLIPRTWQLAWTIATSFLDREGYWHDWVAVQRLALDTVRRAGDRVGQAHAHRGLGTAYGYLGRCEDAHRHLEHAADLFTELGDAIFAAQAQLHRGWVYNRQRDHREAIRHAERAFELYRSVGHRRGQAMALNSIGWHHAQRGQYQQTLDCCQPALATLQELGDRAGAANTWDSLGLAHRHLGHHQQAVACYRQALDLFRQTGYRFGQAGTLVRLGETQQANGDDDAARDAWRQALDILDELGHPDADRVRGKLDEITIGSDQAVREGADLT